MALAKSIAVGSVLFLSNGCAMAPDYIRPEVSHDSHLLQHAPFTAQPTNYGRSLVGVAAIWRRGPWVAEVSESYNFQGGEGTYPDCRAGREAFHGMIGYEIPLK
jgi:hypothetical protein